MSRRALFFVAFIACIAHATGARADEGLDACSHAAVHGQKLRQAGKLREARTWFDVCAQSSCREDIANDCRTWRAETERKFASIMIRLTDERGQPVSGARVLVDGNAVRTEDLVNPVTLDPGPHAVDLQSASGVRVQKSVVLAEGERSEISVTLPTAPAPTPAPTTPPAPPPSEAHSEKRPVPTSALVAGGVSLVGLATFGIGAGLGYSDWSSSACNASCSHGDASRVRTKLVIADVGLGVGIVAGVVATWLYLTRPAVRPSETARNSGFFRPL